MLTRISRHLSVCVLLALASASATAASPAPFYLVKPSALPLVALARRDPNITYDDAGQIANITNPSTGAEVPQASATDGGGSGLDVPAIIWLAFAFAVGVPLMLGGIRLGRLTTGAAIGLSGMVCVWAAFVNNLGADGVSDLVLTLMVLGAFICGFVIGMFNFGRLLGIAALGGLGGVSIGVRIVLFAPNLLVPIFFVNWIIIAVLGVITFLITLIKQRVGITVSAAAVGTFLTALGVDLLAMKQSGMSLGLRHLFDRNWAHVLWRFQVKWKPPIATEVIMAVSLALIPALAYAQHRVFKQPFKRVRTFSLSSRLSADDDVASANRPSAATVPVEEKELLEDDVVATPSATMDTLVSPREDTPFNRAEKKGMSK